MGRSLDVELNTNAPHDTTMNISCSENYELASSLPIRCNNGTWTEEPKCEPARCKILPSPPLNGMVVVSLILYHPNSRIINYFPYLAYFLSIFNYLFIEGIYLFPYYY